MLGPVASDDLLRSLGQLVRGLSALFWGLPIALVVCVQTAQGGWLESLGIVPPLIATSLSFYGLCLLAGFRPHERIWHKSLDRARIFGLANVGLAPFLFWGNRVDHEFFTTMERLIIVTGIIFLYFLNPVIRRLAAMLPDETLRQETRVFTNLNTYLLLGTLALLTLYYGIGLVEQRPPALETLLRVVSPAGLWLVLFLILMPLAMTMALIWKIKEVILASVFRKG